MPVKKEKKGQGKRGAPLGNKNHVVPEDQRRRGRTKNISMPYEVWEDFKASADIYEGGPLTEERYMEIWGDLCSNAVGEFIRRHQVHGDPAIFA